MLSKDHADRLETIIELMIATKDFGEDGVKGILKNFIHKITEKTKELPLKSIKIDFLNGTQWATAAQLEIKLNQVIEAVNELMERWENKNVN